MKLIRIIKNWPAMDLLRQTPGNSGIWEDVQYTLEPVEKCDYAIVLNYSPEDTFVQCHRERIWAFIMEPPIETFAWVIDGLKIPSRVYTPDTTRTGPRFIHSHGALPWHVGKNYDELVAGPVPEKRANLSWVTSKLMSFQGHRDRMNFLERIRGKVDFDLWGRGFTPIADKWDGLAPYRYSLAIENFRGPYYWTEKIADCFLSWTMPIYSGCTNIEDYFPKEAFIKIDIDDPDVSLQINDIIKSDRWKQNLDAIAHARELILNQHQLFPFVTRLIHQDQQNSTIAESVPASRIRLPGITYESTLSPLQRLRYLVNIMLMRSGLKRV